MNLLTFPVACNYSHPQRINFYRRAASFVQLHSADFFLRQGTLANTAHSITDHSTKLTKHLTKISYHGFHRVCSTTGEILQERSRSCAVDPNGVTFSVLRMIVNRDRSCTVFTSDGTYLFSLHSAWNIYEHH